MSGRRFTSEKKNGTGVRRYQERQGLQDLLIDALMHSSQPFGIRYPDGRMMACNQALCDLAGYTLDELKTIDWADRLTPPESRAHKKTAVDEIRRTGGPVRFEQKIIRKDGARVLVSVLGQAVLDAEGNIEYFWGFANDISENRRAEEALQASERELAIRNQIAGIFLTVPDEEMYGEVLCVILKALKSKYGVFGYIAEDGSLVCPSMTRDVWDRCRIPDKSIVFPRETWGGLWGRVLTEKKTLSSNEPFSVPKGHIPMRRALAVPIIHQGNVIGGILVANKRTDYDERDRALLETIAGSIAPILAARLGRDREERKRKQAEEALRAANRLFEKTFASLDDALFLVEPSTRTIVACNAAGERIFGYSLEDMVGRTTEFLHVDRSMFARFGQEMFPALDAHGVYSTEFELRRKDGSVFPSEHSVTEIVNDSGERTGFVSVVRDITARKRSEEELRRIEWLLTRGIDAGPQGDEGDERDESHRQPYADPVESNTCRELLDSVGPAVLSDIAREYLDLLETSSAAYEKNGDYALGIFTSGWCRLLDRASRALCGTDDTREALESGRWHCHESCWTEASKPCTETAQPVDVECQGGIRVYAVPIQAAGEVVGSINFGYGDPPTDPAKLRDIAVRYGVAEDELRELAASYHSRPPFIVEVAKRRLLSSARLIGEMVERKQAEEALRKLTHDLGERVKEMNCLYALSTLVETPDISLEEILQGAADLIPPGWQYPEVTCGRVVLDRLVFQTSNWEETAWRQSSDIVVHGHPVGTVDVCYLEEKPELAEGPFLREERSLIWAIAKQLAETVERRRAAEALRASEEQYRFLAEHAGDAIWLYRFLPEPRYEYVNPAAEAVTGYRPEEYYADPGLWRRIVHPEDRPLYEEFARSPESFAGRPLMLRRIRKDGSVIWTEQHNSLVFDETGIPVANIAVVGDVSERVRAGEELERLRREFLGMVTHELKTPLTAIKGSAATALGSRTPLSVDGYRELFEIIDEQADRLRALADDMLDMTRIETGTLPVSSEPVDLREIVEKARSLFLHSGRPHPLDIHIPDGLPKVDADSQRTVQVVTNLLNNAAQFSPPMSPIELLVEYDTVQVTVHVRDDGRGILPDEMPHLFKKFSQLRREGGDRPGGAGLGLAISKGIIESLGGRIWAESAGEGLGATFKFRLPVAEGALTAVEASGAQGARIRRRGEKKRVLAVDDEPQTLRYLRRCLENAGYETLLTGEPGEVAKLVEIEDPDVVLLDLRLPGVSGFDLLRHIRGFSAVPIIFLTASDRDEDVVRALEMGADDYIKKPFAPSELLARIDVALRRRAVSERAEIRRPFVLGDLKIDFTERRVLVKDHPVNLSATEYKILVELATHAGRVLTHEQILQRVWGPEYSAETELLRSFVRNLRRKLGDDVRQPRFIFTERQVGYRMPGPQ